MKGIARDDDPHMLEVTRLCAKSCEADISQHIGRFWKSSGTISESDDADLTNIFDKNIGKSARDLEVADLFSERKCLALEKNAEWFIE